MVQETLDAFRPLASARGVTLVAELPSSASVRADQSALRQILLNLLDNAVKYGPRDQTVRVGAERHNGRTRIVVDDQGPGIPFEDRERVWEGYFRLQRESRLAVAGSGIGLAVVRSLASEMGGRTWIEDADAGGARFIVELDTGDEMLMRRVLLIEDNADLAFGLRASLEVEGYEVLHGANGRVGLALARDEVPDLLVLDLMLPEMSGYEVLRRAAPVQQ